MPMPSKQQLLLRLAKRENHSWDHLLGVWNAIYDFFKPILEREILDLEENGTWTRLGKMRNKPNFPEEQVLAAKLSKKQVQSMIGSVILHITNKELEDRFETLSLSTNREEDGDALNDTFQIASAHQPAELGISTTVLPKQQCFSRLAESQDRKWDDLLNAWDAVETSEMAMQILLPWEQVVALNLSADEVNLLMRSICYHIATMGFELGQGLHETVSLPVKRSRDKDASDNDFEIVHTPKPVPKRARADPERKCLPITTKVYFMEEDNEDIRTGIMVTLLSNANPENDHLDIKTLRYGNATRHLAKRGTFKKHKHQLFYYDLENPRVRINVDTAASFRAAVEEMAAYRQSEPRIQFCFREKDALTGGSTVAQIHQLPQSRTQVFSHQQGLDRGILP
uniref:Uncharacterized protein n=1 Tax=Talaromyces marneffei PM1 TaxID=1077442 RepID=A0A093W390_TALMA